MSALLPTATIFLRGIVRFGPLRLTSYGLFAAVGLVVALGLSLKTARMAGLAAEKVWDAGLFAVVAAFVVSRLLLIASDVRGFLRLPMVMLSLPSFTDLGMVLTAMVVLAYLRWKQLAVLQVMDAWAPCAAALAAMLSVGKFLEGDDAGMPSGLPWAIRTPLSGGLRVHPVAIYGAVGSAVLVVVLMGLLKRSTRTGMVAGTALVLGGAMSFLLGMVTQPENLSRGAWLDPQQWVAVGAMMAGGVMLTFSKEIA